MLINQLYSTDHEKNQTLLIDNKWVDMFYITLTPKLEAAKRSDAETLVEAVVWA